MTAQAQLSGQIEVSANPNYGGVMNITNLILRASPGPYLIDVFLPDYPQVSTLIIDGFKVLHMILQSAYSTCGVMDITNLILRASPGPYLIDVFLHDYLQVTAC